MLQYRKILVSLLFKGAGVVLAWSAMLLLSRYLGAEAFGIYSVAATLAATLALPLGSGLDIVVVREIAHAKAAGSAAQIAQIRREVSRFVAGFVILVWAVGSGVVLALPMGEAWRWPLLIALASVPPLAMILYCASVLKAEGAVIVSQIGPEILRPGALVLMALVLPLTALATLPLAVFASMANLLALCLAGLFTWAALRRRVPFQRAAEMASGLGRGLYVSIGTLSLVGAGNVLSGSLGIFVLGALAQPEEAGFLRVAFSAVMLLTVGQAAVSHVVAPRVAAAYAEQDRGALARLSGVTGGLIFGFAALGAAPLVWLLSLLLPVMGPGFEAALLPAIVLVIGFCLDRVFCPLQFTLAIAGEERFITLAVAGGLIVNLALCLILVPEQGAVGAAIAFSVSILVAQAALAVRWVRVFGLPWLWLGALVRRPPQAV